MAPQQQVYIVFNAPPPPAYEVKISIPEATTDKPKPQDPMIDMGETRITFGKHKDKRFKEALEDPDYTKWMIANSGKLRRPNMKRLAFYLEANFKQ